MRIGVFALALAAAFAQPAFAAQHSHKYRHHSARMAPIESGYAMPQTFARTDAIDTPFFFSDPSFANRAWTQTPRRQTWRAATAPQFTSFEPVARMPRAPARNGALDGMIARHAAANGLPAELVHRVVIRESRYNPGARNGPNLGLMQIQYRTARGIGYTGSAAGLMDAETNLTYAVRYLAGAYRAAGGNASRAVAYYASGYHGRGVRQPAAPTVQTAAWSAAPSWGMQSQSVMLTDVTSARETRRWQRRAMRAQRNQYFVAGTVTGGF